MSYVDLKHLLADLALEAVQRPDEARWPSVAAAYAELSEPTGGARVQRSEVLRRAAELGPPHTAVPSEVDVGYLASRGLLSVHRDHSVALPEKFLPSAAYLRRQAPRLLLALAGLRGPAADATTPAIRIGAALFNAGLFFECHEWFERLWRATSGTEKDLYHGIVQAAAAFYHYEKNNTHGCRTLMRKARRHLAGFPPHFSGIDLGRFTAELAHWDAHFNGAGKPHARPRLELLPLTETLGKHKGAPRG